MDLAATHSPALGLTTHVLFSNGGLSAAGHVSKTASERFEYAAGHNAGEDVDRFGLGRHNGR